MHQNEVFLNFDAGLLQSYDGAGAALFDMIADGSKPGIRGRNLGLV
jgi:hypothetical protein